MKKTDFPHPNKELAAVCGLYCGACDLYLDTKEGNLARLAEKARTCGKPIEDVRCLGCRSGTLGYFCREHCFMKPCAQKKGLDFCGACEEYPCSGLRDFQSIRQHRIELWKNLDRIEEVGYEQWEREMLERYACPECGTINTAYIPTCRECGHDPSCAYVDDNLAKIREFSPGYGQP